MVAKKALITGVTGQIGAYLTEYLNEKGYEVHGIIRSPLSIYSYEYHEVFKGATLHVADIENGPDLKTVVSEVRPDELYHFAAQSHVTLSWEQPDQTFNTNILGLVRVLEAVRDAGLSSHTRVLSACSSEIFGQVKNLPIDEETPIAPRTPYAISKAACFWTGKCWRDMHKMFVVSAILFNHESHRRAKTFTTYLLAQSVARVVLKQEPHVMVGKLDYLRDWGHVLDGVNCMWMSLQHEIPGDYVMATGSGHSPREFLRLAFETLGTWEGNGIDEVALDTATGAVVVRVDPDKYSYEPNSQVGDSSKAQRELGWKPQKSFQDVVGELTIAAYKRESQGTKNGTKTEPY